MIKNLHPGDEVTSFFILRSKELRHKRDTGETYWSLELGNAAGRIFGSLWGDAKDLQESITEGDIVKVHAKVIEWKGRPYLDIDRLRKAMPADGITRESLLPIAPQTEEVFAALEAKIEVLGNPHLRLLLQKVLRDPQIRDNISKAPAGKLWHHCCLGGLIQHMLNVLNAAEALAPLYPQTDKELLIAGAILHDIGKVFEFKWEKYIDYSDEGRLHGHVVMGYHLVADYMQQIPEFPEELKKQLLHLIVSHHGEREQGAPVLPMTREAILLHYIDELDSRMGAFERIFQQETGEGNRWSRYINLLDCFFYFGETQDKPQTHT